MFLKVCRASPLMRELIDSVIFGQLIMDFELCLKEVFKELKFLSFPVKREHRCG